MIKEEEALKLLFDYLNNEINNLLISLLAFSQNFNHSISMKIYRNFPQFSFLSISISFKIIVNKFPQFVFSTISLKSNVFHFASENLMNN